MSPRRTAKLAVQEFLVTMDKPLHKKTAGYEVYEFSSTSYRRAVKDLELTDKIGVYDMGGRVFLLLKDRM